ncbi:hypothetical protein [Postechiella marina]
MINAPFLFKILKLATFCLLMSVNVVCFAQEAVQIVVKLNTNHVVNGIGEFDREKYITVHADLKASDWGGDNVMPNLRSDFLEKYDVYLGRESGGLSGALKKETYQDDKRPGYPDISKMRESAKRNIKTYKWKKETQGFEYLENRTNNMLVVSQFHPFWPDGNKNKLGLALSQDDTTKNPFGTASGEFAATYIKEYYGGEGEPRPKYMEVINEPDWDLIPSKDAGNQDVELEAIGKLAKFHSTVAKKVKAENPDVLVGGFTCAFPYFEMYDFKRWEYRWKHFIDLTGDDMDFWSFHLYDFPCKVEREGNVVQRWRKGSNIEATLDMLEQYAMMKFGKLKPLIITEYSVQAHEIKFDPWTPYRDWLYVKSANSMLITFMDHPQSVALAIPFFTLKSEWGRKEHPSGNPYRSRLLRQQFEAEGEEGDKWVYTDFIKFYQLWADVKGKRLDIQDNNLDIQTDAYVHKNKVYIIANNLLPEKNILNIDLQGSNDNPLVSIKKKHYHLINGEAGVIDEAVYATNKSIEIAEEATVILEYTFKKKNKLTHKTEEIKYYAKEYYKQIKGGDNNVFTFNQLQIDTESKAVLRVSIARDHGQELKPLITINETEIKVPDNYQGEPQTYRNRFYGTLEIPVDTSLLKENNKINVLFNTDGGQIASVTMRVFNRNKK